MKRNTARRTFKEKLYYFMLDRNGPDALYNFIMLFCIILIFVNAFFKSTVLNTVYLAVFAYGVFRLFSKNKYKRQKENAAYLKIKRKTAVPFTRMRARIRDRKTHVYKKCPSCRSVLRLPKKIGSHTVVCPKCRNRFDITIK